MVNLKLRGHYQYYGVTDNTFEVKRFPQMTKWLLFKWINRRSQKRSYTMADYEEIKRINALDWLLEK